MVAPMTRCDRAVRAVVGMCPMGTSIARGGLAPGPLRVRQLAYAVGQFFLLNREDFAHLHLDVSHQAGAAADVLELGIIVAGCDPADAQSLVGVNGSILVVLALV